MRSLLVVLVLVVRSPVVVLLVVLVPVVPWLPNPPVVVELERGLDTLVLDAGDELDVIS